MTRARFAGAVLVAGLVQLVVYLRVSTWSGTTALLATGYLLFAALGAGYFAARGSALAGALSVFVGAVAYGLFSYFVPLVVADAGQLLDWELRLVVSVIPYAIGGAAAGALGGWLRRRALRGA